MTDKDRTEGPAKFFCEKPCGRDHRASKSEYKQPVLFKVFSPIALSTSEPAAETAGRQSYKDSGMKLLLIFLLLVAVSIEGYYIYLLQDKIEKRNDELRNLSVQLQFLKNEREDMKASLSSANKKTGDAGNGNTAER